MKQLSERVQKEFEKWQEEYEIPLGYEFQVKTLLKLQEEFDEIEKGSNTTKTREVLLHMISSLQSKLRLKEKPKQFSLYGELVGRTPLKKLYHTDSCFRGVGKTHALMEVAVRHNLPVIVSSKSQKILLTEKYSNVTIYTPEDVKGRGIEDYLVEEMPLKTLLRVIDDIGHNPTGGFLYTDLI